MLLLQLVQNYRTGEIELVDVPVPRVGSKYVLVKNVASVVSVGTERSMIELGRKSLLGKARARPDLVKRFLEKAKQQGFIKTFQEALERLDEPVPLGYSSAGVVVEVGSAVRNLSPGDRVACIGPGFASHAEYICVPEMLCSKIPPNVDFDEAAFGMLGIIAMHGIRSANLTMGEKVAVIGLGLLGMLTCQILNAYGFDFVGFDMDSSKVEFAKKQGFSSVYSDVDNFKKAVLNTTKGFGADAVLITAATESAEPVELSVDIVRPKGKIVVVGVADIHPNRNELWHKEAEIVVSKAGGPGIGDPAYEIEGVDYPIGYVRWTESRNLEEFLRLLSKKLIDVKSLITHRVKIHNSVQIYEAILSGQIKPIGVVIDYDATETNKKRFVLIDQRSVSTDQASHNVTIGVIGSGLFGRSVLLPRLRKLVKRDPQVRLKWLVSSRGYTGFHAARKFGFEVCSTQFEQVLEDPEVSAVMILTRHSQHKHMVIESLKKGKKVYVEKPLCVNEQELEEITSVYTALTKQGGSPVVFVGYNRRFSPHAKICKEYFSDRRSPMMINYRVNAGAIPADHWVHSEEEGGGMIVSEVCHFVDLLIYLIGFKPTRVYTEAIKGDGRTVINKDNVVISIGFEDGSVGNIFYTTVGSRAYSRERVEIFCDGKVAVINDFRRTELFGNQRRKFQTINQDMGYENELKHFLNVVKGKEPLSLTYEEIYYSTLAIFKAVESLSRRLPVDL
jgi:predicted dehydrogenase/threonine dehydrogenase-like Zn-dependent dehydrogenase